MNFARVLARRVFHPLTAARERAAAFWRRVSQPFRAAVLFWATGRRVGGLLFARYFTLRPSGLAGCPVALRFLAVLGFGRAFGRGGFRFRAIGYGLEFQGFSDNAPKQGGTANMHSRQLRASGRFLVERFH